MGRPPKGKALTLRPVRLDDDVWAECQRLGKAHGTINEGLRSVLLAEGELITPVIEKRIARNVAPRQFKGMLLKPSEKKK